MKNWLDQFNTNIREALIKHMKSAAVHYEIWQRNRNHGPTYGQSYATAYWDSCNMFKGFCEVLSLLGELENPCHICCHTMEENIFEVIDSNSCEPVLTCSIEEAKEIK